MSDKIEIKEQLSRFTRVPLFLTIVFAGMAVAMYFIDLWAGIMGTIFVGIYFIVILVLYRHTRPRVLDELIDFAAQYAGIQQNFLQDFELPFIVTDEAGKTLWLNEEFQKLAGVEADYRKNINALFGPISRERLEKIETEQDISMEYKEKHIRAHIERVEVKTNRSAGRNQALHMIYFFDETHMHKLEREIENQQMVPGLIYIDNYDELIENSEEMKKSMQVALADRRINRYFSHLDGLVKKTEPDKYFVVVRKQALQQMIEDKFNLLEDIKGIKLGKEKTVTLSMGFGMDGGSYAKNYDYARSAMEFALARGGDQAIVKLPDKNMYFGGTSALGERNTRVKARVKAQALQEILMTRDEFYIMGHSIMDVDAFGAAVGVYCAARQMGKTAHIVLDEVSTSLRPVRDCFTAENGYPEDMMMTSEQVLAVMTSHACVIVVDTNRPSYTECPKLLTRADAIVVFDHHRVGSETIKNAVLSYIEPYASSACEMIAEILQYFDEEISLNKEEADALYAGILIDTNYFMSKTGVRTFEAAAYLRRIGADMGRVRKLLRNDMEAYKARAEAVRRAEVYRGCFAISVCPADNVESPTVASAQAANELLNIVGIKASFVLTDYNGKIYISSRSIDEINVQRIMERLGGGGHISTAGAQLTDCSIEEAKQIIQNTLDEMIKEGDIKE